MLIAFFIFIGIIIIAAIPGARRQSYYKRTGKCLRCKGARFGPIVQTESYKGTTISNRVRMVCLACGAKI